MGSHHDIDRLFPAIEGEDPRAVTALYDRMLAQVFKAGHTGATFGGIGTLDMALWDLKAKLAGEPLWRLLGARDRFVSGYASGLDIALDDDAARDLVPRDGRTRLHQRQAQGRSRSSTATSVAWESSPTRCAATRHARPSCSTPTNRGTSSRPCATSPRSRSTATSPGSRSRCAAGTPPATRASARSITAAVATGENLTGLEQFAPLFDRGAVDIVQVGCVWGVTHFLRVAYAAHSRDLPVSPVGLTANPAVAHAAAAVPNHLSAEVQDLGSPFGVTIDQQFVDGGVVLGDLPGNGITIDEDAIVANQRTAQLGVRREGPHVRSRRAGLRLVADAPAGAVD